MAADYSRLPISRSREMARRSMCSLVAAVLTLAVPQALSAQARGADASTYRAPRIADGTPDLQGIWQVLNTAAFDLQDHAARLGEPAGQGVVEGNDIPYQPWAA